MPTPSGRGFVGYSREDISEFTPVTRTFPGRRELHLNLNSARQRPPFSISCYARARNNRNCVLHTHHLQEMRERTLSAGGISLAGGHFETECPNRKTLACARYSAPLGKDSRRDMCSSLQLPSVTG